ncbi:MAG: hypothetical protein ACOYMB_04100 [Patescibacteria group bacterium]
MKEVEMFKKFFCSLGEICFQIYMVERPRNIYDFTMLEKQSINEDYFNQIRERHPEAIKGFHLSLKKHGEAVQIFLTDTFGVIVEYVLYYKGESIEKTVRYKSLAEAREDQPSFINYLTRSWNPVTE